ncbi:MAG: hypothetical protein ACLP1X_04515 [Polyangiaceae bacterium]
MKKLIAITALLPLGCGARSPLDVGSGELPSGSTIGDDASGSGPGSTSSPSSASSSGGSSSTSGGSGSGGGGSGSTSSGGSTSTSSSGFGSSDGGIACGASTCSAATQVCCAQLGIAREGAGTTATCTEIGQCRGGAALSCTSTASCSSGEACCFTFGARGASASATCQATCAAGEYQLCSADAECPAGDGCTASPLGGSYCRRSRGVVTRDASVGSDSGEATMDATVSGSSSSSGASSSSGSVAQDSGQAGEDATVGGSSSGGSSSSSGGSSGGTSSSSGGSSSGEAGADAGACSSYTPPTCGNGVCDLRSDDCCFNATGISGGTIVGTWSCSPKTTGCSGALSVTFGCSQACDCPSGQVCCGAENGSTATTSCQTVAQGGSCPGGAMGAQLCAMSSECVNGEACIPQACAEGANLTLCGVQSQSPFDCGPREGGTD